MRNTIGESTKFSAGLYIRDLTLSGNDVRRAAYGQRETPHLTCVYLEHLSRVRCDPVTDTEKLRVLRLMGEEARKRLRDPEQRWALRMKFLQQVKSYTGIPYSRKYHQPGTAEYESPLFLDCCGLVRRAMRDLKEDFGFVLGPGNQAYQYDTLPITLDRADNMRPGDLVFVSGTYFNPNKKRQIHDIVHVEVWLGEGEKTVGARWNRGTVQEFESYQFVSTSYGNMRYHFKSIETWLAGICVSNAEDVTSDLNQVRDEKQEVEESEVAEENHSPLEEEGSQLIQANAGGPVLVGRSLDERYLRGLRRRSPLRVPRGELLLQMCDRDRRPDDPRGPGPFFFIGGGNGAGIVASYCESLGWQRIYDKTREDYKLKWCETKSKSAYYNFREGEQLLYQIPNNKVLTTKIGLLCSLREYDRVSGKVDHSRGLRKLKMEEFFPVTYRMDIKKEKDAFFAQHKAVKGDRTEAWICKPTGLNQGRGIFLLRTEEEISTFQTRLQISEDSLSSRKLPFRLPQARIVQRYLQNPLLLKGRKFDVRSYFLIACTTPYMVFFRHGYVRLTCDLYDPNSNNLTSHLTNQYMQKKNPLYSVLKEETVWSMERFNAYVNAQFREAKGLPQDWVLGAFAKRMQAIIVQCFLAVKAKLERKLGLFDLIGCDFMIDEDFKVWLLEMNSNPALHTNCQVLKDVVPSTVTEALDLTLEIFHKCRSGLKLLPLVSQRDFVLLYGGHSTPIYRSRTAGPLRTAHHKGSGTPRPATKTPKAVSVAGAVERSGGRTILVTSATLAVQANPSQPPTATETPRTTTTEVPADTSGKTPTDTSGEANNAETPGAANGENLSSTNAEAPSNTNGETTSGTNAETPSNTNGETPSGTKEETPSNTNVDTPSNTNVETSRSTDTETPTAANAENPRSLVVRVADIKSRPFHPRPTLSRVEPCVSKRTLEQQSDPSELHPPAPSYRVRASIRSQSTPTVTSESRVFVYRPKSKEQHVNLKQKPTQSSQEETSPSAGVGINGSYSQEEGDKKE
ncbi:uncharacterized protein ttll10 [Megalops cyprinoides]|uniref:uncharacterized protein ttll10 n=1 Tax=Megalops cyprinoides TaxID=118141 RepID=UPI001864D85A|nr:uncharacterized protein ttll10 [Megalops cyprinoides]